MRVPACAFLDQGSIPVRFCHLILLRECVRWFACTNACLKGSDRDGCTHVRLVSVAPALAACPLNFQLQPTYTHGHVDRPAAECLFQLVRTIPTAAVTVRYKGERKKKKKGTTTLFTETTFVLLLSIVREKSSAVSPPQRTLVCYVEVGVVSVVQGSINLKPIFLKVTVNASGCLTLRDFFFLCRTRNRQNRYFP